MPATVASPHSERALRLLRTTAQSWGVTFQWPLRPALRWRWAV
jgi:hypothetical protein